MPFSPKTVTHCGFRRQLQGTSYSRFQDKYKSSKLYTTRGNSKSPKLEIVGEKVGRQSVVFCEKSLRKFRRMERAEPAEPTGDVTASHCTIRGYRNKRDRAGIGTPRRGSRTLRTGLSSSRSREPERDRTRRDCGEKREREADSSWRLDSHVASCRFAGCFLGDTPCPDNTHTSKDKPVLIDVRPGAAAAFAIPAARSCGWRAIAFTRKRRRARSLARSPRCVFEKRPGNS